MEGHKTMASTFCYGKAYVNKIGKKAKGNPVYCVKFYKGLTFSL